MNHEKLKCYRQLVSMAEEVARRVSRWPKGHGDLIDQLRRAMMSAVLNLSEGNGKQKRGLDRRRFFRIAMGSIAEVAAALDLAAVFGLIDSSEQASFKSRLRLAYVQIRALP